MKYKLDITGKRFSSVDFYEAEVFWNCPSNLPRTISFDVWGASLLIASHWGERRCHLTDLNLPTDADDIYISGFSTVVFEGVIGGSVESTVYQSDQADDFMKSDDGELVRLKRNWEYKKSPDLYLYEMYCVLDWPFGYCHFILAADGNATLEFDTEHCIPTKDFVMNPQRYGFKRGQNASG